MNGKIFRLSDKESPEVIGKEFIFKHKDRWEDFNFGESSIDLAVKTAPIVVVDNIAYDILRQYFIKDGSDTIRLILVYPLLMEKDNKEIHDRNLNATRYGTGFIPGLNNN